MALPDGSLAGVQVAATAIAQVDGEKGEARVRGYLLQELARKLRYEEVAFLVLRGERPSPVELERFRSDLARGAAQCPLPRAGEGEGLFGPVSEAEALVAALALIAAGPKEAPELLLGRFPDACAAAAGRPKPDPGASYARRSLAALGATRADAAAERALEVLLSLESEHGISASSFAARVAASSGGSLASAMAAGAAALGGPRHGGATAQARELLRAAAASGDPRRFVREHPGPVPGFGHRVYKVPDPRVPPLREALATLGKVPLLAVAEAIEAELLPKLAPKRVYPNVDFYGAVLLDALGVPPTSFVAAFALGVAPGWLAHAMEQQASGRLVRPDSAYVGPPPRDL
jgi:citrate synthase